MPFSSDIRTTAEKTSSEWTGRSPAFGPSDSIAAGSRKPEFANRSPSTKYERLGWHRNPFGELDSHDRAGVAVVDVAKILSAVTDSHTALQIIGRCGRGKSTRLHAVHAIAKQSSYTYIPRWRRDVPIAAAPLILIDEAQRMTARARRSVFGSGLPLVLATHIPLGLFLRRHGYRVTTLRIGRCNTPALIAEVLRRRIQAASIDGSDAKHSDADSAWSLTEACVHRLHRRFGSDLRAIEDHLYETIESLLAD